MGIPETEISLLLVLYGDRGERSTVVTFGLSQKTLTDALNLPSKGGGHDTSSNSYHIATPIRGQIQR
jgi:hypothetical protein